MGLCENISFNSTRAKRRTASFVVALYVYIALMLGNDIYFSIMNHSESLLHIHVDFFSYCLCQYTTRMRISLANNNNNINIG